MKKTTIILLLGLAAQLAAQQPTPDARKMYHQFDFWLGHWQVYKFGTDTIVGDSHIETIIDSVGILENYTTVKGRYAGKSLNKYNPAKDRWEQYWIDNSGLTLYLSGGITEEKMVLDDLSTESGSKGNNKIIWEAIDKNTVRQTWSVTSDNGKTWKVAFDGEYRRVEE